MKKFIVISHTHWDREWYMSFASFRLKLVDLIDRFFLILEKDKDYIFHLDAQTVVLEDYLEIRPAKKDLLKKYIASGNIRVGPWYLQNDFYLTDGESTVRNLQRGIKIANEFGKCGTVGYAPDQFGNISQMPQILKNFGIDNFVFGRGLREYETVDGVRKEKRLPAEFEWIGADGTRCLAIHLKCWYNNAQHIPEELSLSKLLLDINEKNFEGLNLSPYILLMNGVDHLEPQDDVREIIARLQKEGIDIKQSSLDDYVADLKEYFCGKQLPTITGPLNRGGDYDVLKGCWSSRIYLKRDNVRTEDLLENKLEALYSYLERSGLHGAYPADELDYLWRGLMKNQPHDSICGCSLDSVHAHMEDSYVRLREMGEDLLARGLRMTAAHSGHVLADEKNYSVTVFNGTEREKTSVVEAEINFVIKDGVKRFALYDEAGMPVPYELVSEKEGVLDVISPLNLPGILDVNCTKIRFTATVPPFTARVYAIVPNEQGMQLSADKGGMPENEYYRIFVEDGELCIEEKGTGTVYRNPVILEDGADKGDAYVYRKPSEEALRFLPTSFETPAIGALRSSLTFKFSYPISANYDFAADRRSENIVGNELAVTLTLESGNPVIGLDYTLTNRAKDHRIRLIFACGKGGALVTDSPFDCAERFPLESCDVTDSDTHHNSTFVSLAGEKGAFHVFTEGQHEVARTQDGLAFTLLRATEHINRNNVTYEPVGGKCWHVPENQCLRTVCGRMGFEFGIERGGAELWATGKLFRNGLLCHADSFDTKKYSGGRFAVQSAELEKFYYVKDKFEDKTIAHAPFFTYDSKEVALTCCKQGLKGGTILRLVNLSNAPVEVLFQAQGRIYMTDMSEQQESLLGEQEVRLAFGPKQIVTLHFGTED